MYAEKHYFQNRLSRWLQWASVILAIWQLVALFGAEIGQHWIPFGYTTHLLILICAAAIFVAFHNTSLSLRISNQGWAFRGGPYHYHDRYIGWTEIKSLRLLNSEALPQKQKNGFAQSFLISNPAYKVLCIELTSGFQVFVSVQKPGEMMEYLHNQLLQPELKKKVRA